MRSESGPWTSWASGEARKEERHRQLRRRGLGPEGLGGRRQGRQRHVDRERPDRHHGREQDADRAAQTVGGVRRASAGRSRGCRRPGPYGSAHEPREGRRVDVRAADDHADPAAAEPLAQRTQQRRGGRGPGRLDGELGPAEEESHRAPELLVADEHEIVERTAAELEAVRRGVGRAQAVGDRPDGLDRLRRFPAARLRRIESAPSGSTPKTWQRGRASLTAVATPAHEAAAADRHDHGVEVRRLRRRARARGWPCRGPCAALRTDGRRCGPRWPRSRAPARTPGARSRPARPRRPTTGRRPPGPGFAVLRHHDLGRRAEHPGGVAHRDGVIARAEGGHAAGERGGVERQHDGQRPARLEGARVLEELELEERPASRRPRAR